MRVAIGMLVAQMACGPGVAQTDTRTVGRDVLADAANDPARLEQLLRGSVVNGGLWFEDAKCAAEFATPGEIPPAQFREFARCLATLHIQPSPRNDALGDVVVMEYAPGFEIEARVVRELDGPRLSWIGFEARRDASDDAPTLGFAAFERLRTAGDPTGPVDPNVGRTLELDPTPNSHGSYAWLKVCIDETGAMTSATVFETTSVAASDVFRAAVQGWQFKPFTIQGQPMPVCSMARLVYPPGQGPVEETLPLPPPPSRSKKPPIVFAAGVKPTVLEGHRIAGTKNIAPDARTKDAIRRARIGRIIGSFRLCLDDAGHVESVLPLLSTGFASYDRDILAVMQKWLYQPYTVNGEPVPVCTAITFIYTQR